MGKFNRTVTDAPLYQAYHDQEWGVALYDDQRLFELLILEAMQAGLSWLTVLKKREHYRRAFDNFAPDKIACYDQRRLAVLMKNPGIIRNERKIKAIISNAQAYLEVEANKGSFSQYIWQFVGHKPRVNHYQCAADIPVWTAESARMSKQLKQDGFKFVGKISCYSFMQAAGMVNDHTTDCFAHKICSISHNK